SFWAKDLPPSSSGKSKIIGGEKSLTQRSIIATIWVSPRQAFAGRRVLLRFPRSFLDGRFPQLDFPSAASVGARAKTFDGADSAPVVHIVQLGISQPAAACDLINR